MEDNFITSIMRHTIVITSPDLPDSAIVESDKLCSDPCSGSQIFPLIRLRFRWASGSPQAPVANPWCLIFAVPLPMDSTATSIRCAFGGIGSLSETLRTRNRRGNHTVGKEIRLTRGIPVVCTADLGQTKIHLAVLRSGEFRRIFRVTRGSAIMQSIANQIAGYFWLR
jgi:hypothetical protein